MVRIIANNIQDIDSFQDIIEMFGLEGKFYGVNYDTLKTIVKRHIPELVWSDNSIQIMSNYTQLIVANIINDDKILSILDDILDKAEGYFWYQDRVIETHLSQEIETIEIYKAELPIKRD